MGSSAVVVSLEQGSVAHDAVDSGNPVKIGGKAHTSTPTAVADADRVNAYFDTTGHQHVKVDAVSGTVTVSGAVTAQGSQAHDAANTQNPLIVGGQASTAEPTAVANGDVVRMYLDANGYVFNKSQGNVAHDAVDAGNPAKIGGRASTTTPTAVAAGDRVNAWYDLNGRARCVAEGAVAHDAVNTGQPLIGGGQASTSEPTAVANGDAVRAYFDANGYQFMKGQGNIAHDAVDSGNPMKIGGIAGSSLPTAVAANDRVNAAFDLEGRQRVKNYRQEAEGDISDLNTTYTTTADVNSADVTITGYRTGTLIFTLAEAGAPTYIQFRIQAKDGTLYFDMDNGFLGMLRYSEANIGTGISKCIKFALPDTNTMRVVANAVGVDGAGNNITVTNATLYLGT